MGRVVFVLLLLLGLAPVWGFRYLPTADGASHVLNALVFRDCEEPAARDHEFFARRLSPIPNWTATASLVGLTGILPPLAAEKVLASIYLIGLPIALARFLAAFGGGEAAVVLGLPLLWNRCFFLGFYNYALSLIVFFVVLGRFLQVRDRLGPRQAGGLGLLLLAAYFTHLVGFLLTAGSLLWLAAIGPGPKKQRTLGVLGALVPAALLTLWYLGSSGFFSTAAAPRAARRALAGAVAVGPLGLIAATPEALHRELFAAHAGAWPLGLAGLAVLVVIWNRREDDATGLGWQRSVLGLSVLLLALFVFAPDHLGPQGGFLKARLAPLPFLVALGALRTVSGTGRRALGLGLATAVAVLNLGLVLRHVAAVNHELDAFTAGVGLVRSGETLVALKPKADPAPLVDPFAAEYYCLAAHAVCLSNYEGATGHFPVRLRSGAKERVNENRPGSFWADVILGWNAESEQVPLAAEPYREVYRQGSLRLWRRE